MRDREIIENTECEIVNEVREIRHKISARFNHDVSRMVAHYQEVQEKMRRSGKYKFADLPRKNPKLPESVNSEVAD